MRPMRSMLNARIRTEIVDCEYADEIRSHLDLIGLHDLAEFLRDAHV